MVAARPTDRVTAAATVAYVQIGWAMSGLGAALPELRDALGGMAGWYPPVTGAALLVIGLVALRRPQAERVGVASLGWAALVAAAGTVALCITTWRPLSALGALVAGSATARIIRLLPAVLTSRHGEGARQAITRANAWSSTASIIGPLAIGAASATALGWRAGLVVAPAVGGLVTWWLTVAGRDDGVPADTRPAHSVRGIGRPARRIDAAGPDPRQTNRPWVDAWLTLAVSIMIEFAFVYFAATYLQEESGLSKPVAAAGAAAFAVGMAAARFAIRSSPPLPNLVAVIAGGFGLMWFVPSPAVAIAGIAVAGVGTALLYPLGIGRLMSRFPDSVEDGAARGALASGTALLASPVLLGVLRSVTDVRIAYLSVPVLLAALLTLDPIVCRRALASVAAAG